MFFINFALLNIKILKEMESYGFINAEKLPGIVKDLKGSELKMLLLILCYLSSTRKQYLVNNEELRKYMASMNYDVTPERTCMVLSSLVKKGILKREVKGVFSVLGDLYIATKVTNMDNVKLEN